jgi:hypothetical protein
MTVLVPCRPAGLMPSSRGRMRVAVMAERVPHPQSVQDPGQPMAADRSGL